MTKCIDIDTLPALAGIAAEPLTVLDHIAACAACRTRISEAAMLRRELAGRHPLREGFVESVVAALPAAKSVASERPAPSRAAALGWTAVHGLLGAGLGLFVAMSAGSAAPGGGSPLVAVGLAAAVALALARVVDKANAA